MFRKFLWGITFALFALTYVYERCTDKTQIGYEHSRIQNESKPPARWPSVKFYRQES